MAQQFKWHASRQCLAYVMLIVTGGNAFTSIRPTNLDVGLTTTLLRSSSTEIVSPMELEREIVRLGRKGNIEDALGIYQEIQQPSIRLLNSAIDACARARPTRLEHAFELLNEGLAEKNLRPNVFTFGSLMSACSRSRNPECALRLLRSMEVSRPIRMKHGMSQRGS